MNLLFFTFLFRCCFISLNSYLRDGGSWHRNWVFFFSMSVCNNCFKFSNFKKLILKYLNNFCLSSMSKQSGKFSFLFSCLKHFMNPIFSVFFSPPPARRESPKATITSSSHRSIPMTVKSGSSTLQERRSVKLLD